jgi:hypothetical protein
MMNRSIAEAKVGLDLPCRHQCGDKIGAKISKNHGPSSANLFNQAPETKLTDKEFSDQETQKKLTFSKLSGSIGHGFDI